MVEDRLFYVGRKAFIERDGEVLVLHDPVIGLDFPGGKIQEGEADFVASLQREVGEETGLEIAVGDPFTTWSFPFDRQHPEAGRLIYLVGFKCRYRAGEVRLSEEHDGYRWVNEDNYTTLASASVYYQALEKYFRGIS